MVLAAIQSVFFSFYYPIKLYRSLLGQLYLGSGQETGVERAARCERYSQPVSNRVEILAADIVVRSITSPRGLRLPEMQLTHH